MTAAVVAAVAAGAGAAAATGSSAPRAEVPAAAMVRLLERLLPAGTVSGESGTGLPAPSARLVLADRRGAATVTASARRLPVPVPAALAGCPDRAYFPFDRCTRTGLPGGAVLVLDQGYADPLQPRSPQRWAVLVTGRDGGQVSVSETAALPGPGSAPSPATLPLTAGQLTAVASAAGWAAVLAAMPAPPAPPPPPSTPAMLGARIVAIARRLLPPAVPVAAQYQSAGYAELTVTGGYGRALITITAQQWSPGSPDMARLFRGSPARPGGTRVRVAQGPSGYGGKGAIQWQADTLRATGLRILVTELNAPAYGLPATTAAPPIARRQLVSLATSPIWHT